MKTSTRLGYNGTFHEGHPQWQLLGNGYRAYNPASMRFHAPDSMSPFGRGGINAYAYCGNDSINRVDPSGHFIQYLPVLVLGAGAVGAIAWSAFSKETSTKVGLAVAAAALLVATVATFALTNPTSLKWMSGRFRRPSSAPSRSRAPSESPSELQQRLLERQRAMLGHDANDARHLSNMHRIVDIGGARPARGTLGTPVNNASRTGQLPDVITSHVPGTRAGHSTLPQDFARVRRSLSKSHVRYHQPLSPEQRPIRVRADYVHPRRRAFSIRHDAWSR